MFDDNFVLDHKLVGSTKGSYQTDLSCWCMHFGMTYHITRELENLAIRNMYQERDQMHTANRSSMNIIYASYISLTTPSYSFIIKDVLYTLPNPRFFVSIHRPTYDNRIFIKL